MNSFKVKKNDYQSNIRINLVLTAFTLAFIVIVIRLFQIQIVNGQKYRAIAEDQYWTFEEIPARRGDISSSDGFVLAGTKLNYLLFVEPKKVKDKYKLANALATYLSTSRCKGSMDQVNETTPSISCDTNILFSEYSNAILTKLDTNLMWLALERNLNQFQKEDIEKLGYAELGFDEEPVQFYPENTLAAHVLGFVGSTDTGEKQGYFGIEGMLDADLKGKPGRISQEKDARGGPILVGGYRKIDPIPGRNVTLTINRGLQYIVEKRLKEGVQKYDAVSGTAILMDPSTGDILVMANYPTYSPGSFYEEVQLETNSLYRNTIERRNSAIAETYEPGSVIKPLTVSAAIDLHLVDPYTTYDDPGYAVYSTHTIRNWDLKSYGTMNVIQLLQKSNNIGAAWVGTKVGAERLYTYFSSYGLGVRAGIDLEGEDTGILRDAKEWRDIDTATASFGQGLSATPLQVVAAFNTIANGGNYVKPRIIKKIADPLKDTQIPVKVLRRVISKDTSDTLVSILEQAAVGGEAKYFVLKDYKIGGKTGTAQIPEAGGYAPDKTNATFVGFLSGKTRLTLLVRLKEPHTSIYAAETAAPLWMSIIEEVVKFYGILPDRGIAPEAVN